MLTGDRTLNLGMCPDWELNPQSSRFLEDAPTIWATLDRAILSTFEVCIRVLFEVQRNHSLHSYFAGFLINSLLAFLSKEGVKMNLYLLMATSKHSCSSSPAQDVCPDTGYCVPSWSQYTEQLSRQQPEGITLSVFEVRVMRRTAYGSFSVRPYCTKWFKLEVEGKIWGLTSAMMRCPTFLREHG